MRLIEKFNVATVSDIHLGNPRNDAVVTIANLDEVIINSGLLKRIRLLVIAGDLFDRLLDLANPNVVDIDRWFVRLLLACKKHNVIFRLLEGTPSHDRQQGSRFTFLDEISRSENAGNFRYVTDVSIEYIPELGINALYVPDEAYPTTGQTKQVVQELLAQKGLSTVELAFMHGFFQYQIPYQTKEDAYHDIDFYMSIVTHWIFIGHVHTHSRYGNVIAQGSFDRNAHGEEEPKGMAMATVADPKGDKMWFLENKGAHVYRTIQVYTSTVAEVFETLEKRLVDAKPFERYRIEAESSHPIFQHMVEVQKRWPTLNFTKHPKDVGDKEVIERMAQESEVHKWERISITRDNLCTLMIEKMTKNGIEAARIKAAMEHLESVL